MQKHEIPFILAAISIILAMILPVMPSLPFHVHENQLPKKSPPLPQPEPITRSFDFKIDIVPIMFYLLNKKEKPVVLEPINQRMNHNNQMPNNNNQVPDNTETQG